MGTPPMPITFFLNAEGYFEAYFQGTMPADVLQSGIDMLLGSE